MKLKKISRTITESYFRPDFCCEEFETLYMNNVLKIHPSIDIKITVYSDENNDKNPENIGMYLSQDWRCSKLNFCPFCGEKISEEQ